MATNKITMNKKIIIQQEISFNAVGYTKPAVTDDFDKKVVTAKFNLIADDGQAYDYNSVILWEGDSYEAIGAWTNEDVANRIEEILNN